jgi:hypothetical protein
VKDETQMEGRQTLNQPFPIPLSVFASDTFFRYAMTGPLWLESMTSLDPWRHCSVADEPACTVMTVLVFAVGLEPPLHAMSLEVTSWMGCALLVVCLVEGRTKWTYTVVCWDAHAIADCAPVQ